MILHSAGASPHASLPMVIAIHGFGDRPANFSKLLAHYPEPARLIFPRATTRHGRGFSWFGRGAQRTPGLRRAADQLAAMIAELVQRYPTKGKPVVTGFSQGGMLSFALAVLHPSVISAAVPLAGVLPVELVPERASDDSPPILALHGDADSVLPIEPTRKLTQLLRARGFHAQLTEYPDVAHTVSDPMHRAMTVALIEAARDPAP